MKLKIDDIFLNNSVKDSINIERRLTVTIPYEDKFYLLIAEMNCSFKENNPRLFGIQTSIDIDTESEETVVDKSYGNMQELYFSMKPVVINYLANCSEDRFINYCKKIYQKNHKEFNDKECEKQTARFLTFNKATIHNWESLKSDSFVLGKDQDVNEWNIFWKYIEMQKFAEKYSKKLANVKIRKI